MIRALASQSAVYAGATIVQRGAQMVMLLILPAFLSPADYGAVQMMATVLILVNLVAPLEITQALARFTIGAPEPERRAYGNSAWWFTVAIAALLLLVGLTAQDTLSWLILGTSPYLEVYRLGVVLIALFLLFYFLQNQFRWNFDPAGYALVSIVFAVVTMSASIGLAVFVEPAVEGVMLGQLIGAGAAVLVAVLRLQGFFRLRFDKARFRQMVAFSLPLVPAQLAIFATLYSGRVIINDLATLHEVGLFAFATQIAAITSLATLGINTALTPLIMAHHKDPSTPPMLARMFEGFSAVAAMLCLILGFFAPYLVGFTGSHSYSDAGPLVMILAPAAILSQMYIFAPGFFIAKKTVIQMLVSIVSAVVAVSANYVLVHRFGIIGGAVGSLIGALTFLLLWIALSQRLYRLPFRWGRIGIMVAVGVAVAVVGSADSSLSPLWDFVYRLALIAGVGLVAMITGILPGPGRVLRLASAEFRRRRSAQPGQSG